MRPVKIGDRLVGPGLPTFIIGEMSANHDRDLAHALKLMEIAAAAGVDAVKLQTYSADSLTLPTDHLSAAVDPVWGARNLYELYDRAAMPYAFHAPLFAKARELGILCFSSIYDERDIPFLEEMKTPAYKIASFELVHIPLLRAIAPLGKPVILSTGMADMSEIKEAVTALRDNGCNNVILLHCVSAYPTPVAECNLAAVDTLATAFDCPVGFSDHTIGKTAAVAAVARGATAIEKHFTSDPQRSGPDHRFSIDPQGLREFVSAIREIERAIGTGVKQTSAAERVNKQVGRRSIFAAEDVPAGRTIGASAIRVVRPGAGLHPREFDRVAASRARRPIIKGTPITAADIES